MDLHLTVAAATTTTKVLESELAMKVDQSSVTPAVVVWRIPKGSSSTYPNRKAFVASLSMSLKKLAKTEKRAIEALTTNNIAKTFAPHAKEDDESASAEQGGSRRGSQKGKFDPPGVAAVFDDYRRLIDHKDQMSQAQFRVWTLVQEAKDSFDHFVEAARAVAPCEHYLWSHCDELCVEHDAVLELRAICLRLRDDLMRLA